ncbi:hypothetical protein AO057_01600 [Curvibacter sp. PAE-UM]|nr:hypothetical protein AO057_01600 [Curvibacter sp. PAE-UM]
MFGQVLEKKRLVGFAVQSFFASVRAFGTQRSIKRFRQDITHSPATSYDFHCPYAYQTRQAFLHVRRQWLFAMQRIQRQKILGGK